MGFKSEGILAGFILNAFLMPILLIIASVFYNRNKIGSVLLWKVFRPLRPEKWATYLIFAGPDEDAQSQFMKTLFRMSDPWLNKVQGDEVNLYLSFLKLCMMAFIPIGVILLVTLAPLNNSSDYYEQYTVFELEENYTPGVADWTSRNIASKSSRWWGVFILSIVVTAELYGLIINIMHQLRRVKARQQPHRTAEIKRVKSVEEAKAKIPGKFHKLIQHIEVPKKPVENMIETMEKRENAIANLEHYYALCEKEEITGEDRFTHEKLEIKTKLCCGDKVNAITYWRGKVDKYDEQLEEMSKQVEEQDPMGMAYVTFKDPADCAKLLMETNVGWYAPNPKCVIWEHTRVHIASYYLRSFLTICLLVFLALIWTSLIGFLGSIDEFSKYIPGLDSLMNTKQEVRDAVTTYAPIIAVAALIALLPYFMRFWTHYVELVPTKTKREMMVLRKLFVFLLFTTVILQAAAQGAGDSLSVLFGMNTTKMIATFTNMIVPTSGYFPVIVLQTALSGNIIRSLKIGDVVLGPILSMTALTQRERDSAYAKRPFYFSEEYASALLMFAFAILFSVNVPYIPILGFLFFFVRFIVDRAVLADCYPRCRDSDLSMVPTVVSYVVAMTFLMQFMGVTVLTLNKERFDVFGVSFVPCVLTLGLAVWVWRAEVYTMGPELMRDVANGTYRDPTDAPTFCNIIGNLVWGDNNTIFAEEYKPSTDPSVHVDAALEYRHPCAKFVPTKFNHEAMAEKSWYVSAKDEDAFTYEITASSVCFSNPKPPPVDEEAPKAKEVEEVPEEADKRDD
eukprot:TRINITY_DN5600_c0_g1_i1.p1 TRINITY_DN5600_c0_g1~~TRINITY_DN5600_c0_g1_i1.p1  ORF type:complete len:809 (+),score=298.08 TRINITY_DN5600_c0_g1_i1:54-2429(+)